MTKLNTSLLAAALLAVATPAFAADLTRPVAAAPATAPAMSGVTLSIEAAPEFSQATGAKFNQLTDSYYTGGISYALAPNWTVGATLKDQEKNDATSGLDHQDFFQGTVGYKLKLSDAIGVNLSTGVGITWGTTGYTGNVAVAGGEQSFFYYLASIGADVKLTPQLTWNAINVQYKNGFNVDYLTPSAYTGLTYAIDKHSAVYTKATYNWTDSGLGSSNLTASKYSVALGYKYSF